MRWTRADWPSLVFFLALYLSSSLAFAGDKATAEALFQAGKAAMKAGRIDEACEKFAASQAEDASPGTLLNLANCHEKQGKTATAWAEYKEASYLAQQRGEDDRSKVAFELAADLEPRLSKLIIRATIKVAGLEVLRDAKVVKTASLDVPVPVDPGTYKIEAHAPNHAPWTTSVNIPSGQTITVTVPALAPTGASTPEPPVPTPTPQPDIGADAGPGALLITGIVLGVVGVGGLVAGGVLGGLASSEKSDADALCPDLGCTQEGFDMVESARTKAHASTTSFIIGGVFAAVGVTLIAVDLSSGDNVSAACNFSGCGLQWKGSF